MGRAELTGPQTADTVKCRSHASSILSRGFRYISSIQHTTQGLRIVQIAKDALLVVIAIDDLHQRAIVAAELPEIETVQPPQVLFPVLTVAAPGIGQYSGKNGTSWSESSQCETPCWPSGGWHRCAWACGTASLPSPGVCGKCSVSSGQGLEYGYPGQTKQYGTWKESYVRA